MAKWKAVTEGVFTRWAVVEQGETEHHRYDRLIADDLNPEEAALIANAHAMRDALGLLLNAALEEELPESVVRMAAMEVYLAAQGLGDRSAA